MARAAAGRARLQAQHLLSAAALACALLLSACAGGNGPADTAALPGTTAPLATEKAAPVKVALLVPLSGQGPSAVIGASLKQAAELALFERDNPNVQLVVKDDKGTPEGAKAAAEDALKSGAKLILGPLFAKSVTVVAPLARQAGVPVIAFSNDRHVAGNGVHLLSFLVEPEVTRIVGYATQQGKRRFAALVPEDAAGQLAGARFKEAVSRAGGTVIAYETYPPSANRVLEPMRKVALVIRSSEESGAPIDALFVPGGQESLEIVGRLLPQADIDTTKVKLLGTGGMDYPNAGRDAKLVGAWYPGPDPNGWNDFAQKYAKSYGQSPPRIASLAHDAITVAAALASTRGYSAADLTRANGFTGIDGGFRFLSDGSAERSLAILEVQKFGAGVVQAPQGVASPAAAPSAGTSSSPLSSLFNFN